jgi:hypothetical protein
VKNFFGLGSTVSGLTELSSAGEGRRQAPIPVLREWLTVES